MATWLNNLVCCIRLLMGIRVYESYDFHFESQFFHFRGLTAAVGRGVRGAAPARVQLQVLQADIRKSVLEIRNEPAEVVKVSRPANSKHRRPVRKLWQNSHLACHLAAKLRDLHIASHAEFPHGLDYPGIHVARSHSFFDG